MQMPTNMAFAGGWGKRRRRKTTTEWQVTSCRLSKLMLMKSLLLIYSFMTLVRMNSRRNKAANDWETIQWVELKWSLVKANVSRRNHTKKKISHDFGTHESPSFASTADPRRSDISNTLTEECNIRRSCFYYKHIIFSPTSVLKPIMSGCHDNSPWEKLK